jgi:hypothetical protein
MTTTAALDARRAAILNRAGAIKHRCIPTRGGQSWSANQYGWDAATRTATAMECDELEAALTAAEVFQKADDRRAAAEAEEATARAAAGAAEDERNRELQRRLREEAAEFDRKANDVPTLLRAIGEKLDAIAEELQRR